MGRVERPHKERANDWQWHVAIFVRTRVRKGSAGIADAIWSVSAMQVFGGARRFDYSD